MTTNNHSILPLSSSDLPTLVQFVQESKLGLTINRLLFKDWPNEVAQRANYTNAVESGFKHPWVESFKVVDDESELTVGHLVLARKRPREAEVTTGEGDEKSKIPEGVNAEVFTAVRETILEIDTEKDVDHLELTHIFVKLSHRRRGIGSQLVRLAVEKAEKAGIPLSVFSEPGAHDFFLNRGFNDTKYADIDLAKWAPKYSGFGVFRLSGMYVKLLLETGKVDVDSKDMYGGTPLSRAAENGHEAVVKLLLETGRVGVNVKDKTGFFGETPLWQAASNGHEAVVKLLLDTGKVDVNSKDRNGRTPLSRAVSNGHEAIIKLLVETGKVDVDSKDRNGRTPLSRAASHGHEAVVKLLS